MNNYKIICINQKHSVKLHFQNKKPSMKNYLLIIFPLLVFSVNSSSQGVFQRVLGNVGIGYDIIESSDHNFIFTGLAGGGEQVIVSKIDSAGDTIWVKYFGPTIGNTPSNVGHSITYISNDRYLITGNYDPGINADYSNLYAIIIDSAGNEIWENNYGNGTCGGNNAVYDSINKKIYFVGYVNSTSVLLIKTDTAGNFIWSKTYTYGSQSVGIKIAMRNDTDIFIVGYMSVTGNNTDGILLEVDSAGTVINMKHFGGNLNDEFNDLRILPDSGFMVAGRTINNLSHWDGWLLRFDKNLDTLWSKVYSQDSFSCSFNHFTFSSSNTYWICGFSSNYITTIEYAWICETDTIGNVLYNGLYGTNQYNSLASIIESTNHSILAIGDASGAYLVRLDSDYLYNGINENLLSEKIVTYPNPSNGIIYLKVPENINFKELQINIVDVLAKKYSVNYSQLKNNLISVSLPFANGLYILTLQDKKHVFQNKIILQK